MAEINLLGYNMCKIVAATDLFLGAAAFFTLGYHLFYREIKLLHFPREYRWYNFKYWMIFGCSPIQFGLGVLLCRAVSLEDEVLCLLWYGLSLPLIYFAFPVFFPAGFEVIEKFIIRETEDHYYPEPAPEDDQSEVDISGIYCLRDSPPKYEPPPPYHVAIAMPTAKF